MTAYVPTSHGGRGFANLWTPRLLGFLWGLQFSLINPSLPVILSDRYSASADDIGLALIIYNTSGFFFSIVLPMLADRKASYKAYMTLCSISSVLFVALTIGSPSFGLVLLWLALFGGPASIGTSLLFAYTRSAGLGESELMNVRASVSLSWVLGPPAGALIASTLGPSALLFGVCTVSLSIGVLGRSLRSLKTIPMKRGQSKRMPSHSPARMVLIMALLVGSFSCLQGANIASVSTLGIFVSDNLRIDVMWAGIALGLSAALEVPALGVLARIGDRISIGLIMLSGCVAGLIYFSGLQVVEAPLPLLALQPLNSWFCAVLGGTGLGLFQRIIPRPGLASGVYTNARRVGAVLSGLVISAGHRLSDSMSGVFLLCTVLIAVALVVIVFTLKSGAVEDGSTD